jgi:GNAT superfamily N-acetyltransferase
MTVTLEPMSAERFASWNEQQVRDYAQEKVDAGIWAQEDALASSAAEQDELLSDGLDTAGHDIFVATVGGEEVGNLWLFTNPVTRVRESFIYNIEVDETHRGKGLGRALLTAAEQWCITHGVTALRLNVFSFNTRAINLYESAGFAPTNMNMMKRISPA